MKFFKFFQKKQSSAAQQRSKDDTGYLRNIIDALPYPFYTIDLNYKIMLSNQAAKSVGIEEGQYCFIATHNSEVPCSGVHVCPLKKVMEKKKAMRFEHIHCDEFGNEKRVEIYGAPIYNKKGEVIQLIESTADITYRHKAEKVLKDYQENLKQAVEIKTQQLEKAYQQLQESKRLSDIGSLSATLAHELRNPLAAIKLVLCALQQEKNPDNLEEHAEAINQKITECDAIIKNFLSYAKIKKPQYEKIKFFDVFSEVIQFMSKKYAGKKVELELIFQCEEGLIIEADPFQIKELLYNIADNAYQALPEEKARIVVKGEIGPSNECLIINFQNNGAERCKQENLSHLFDPFFSTKARGIGLGLTVCKQIATLHKGNIELTCHEKEKVFEVRIVLPLKEPQENSSQAAE